MTSAIEFWGKRYGYPDCCIESFKQKILFCNLSPERQKASQYGYIPCQTCAEGILNGTLDIQKIIQEKRTEPKPFKEYVLPKSSFLFGSY